MSPALAVLATLVATLPPLHAQAAPVAENAPAGVRLGPWLVLGPFDNPRGADVSSDPGVEKLVKRMKAGAEWPALKEEFAGRGKAKLAWREADPALVKPPQQGGPFDTGTLDLHALLGAAGDNLAGYLYRTVEADAAGTVELACGSDDGLRLWFDGELLVDKGVPRVLGPFDDRVTLALAPGRNHLLVKVTNAGGAWLFAMRAPPRRAAPEEINLAIDRGVARLLELQLLDGSWGGYRDDYPNGQTALSVYTLVKCGVSPRHRAILQAVECLRAEPVQKTYSLACQILALISLRDPALDPWIRASIDQLLGWQGESGGWSYPSELTDLSNTHLAAFSLRAAVQAGFEVPAATWNDAAAYALRNQESRRKGDGAAGFVYHPGHDSGYTGSMTAAGIAVLASAREALGERMLANTRAQVEPAIEAGLAWLARNWSVNRNPNKADWVHYYLYGIERVCALLEVERIGEHDWYAEGADYLVSTQDKEGGWGWEHDTCFALLFLRRATSLPVTSEVRDDGQHFATAEGAGALRLRAKLGAPASLWIDSPQLAKGQTLTLLAFFARFGGEEWKRVAAAAGLAARLPLDRPGRWELRAEAQLSDGSTLASGVLVVEHEDGPDPVRMAYASDATRNRLPALKPEARASSALEPAANAVDNKVWTRWLCAETDADPWLELDPKKPAEAARLVLAHARTTRAAQRYANPRPTRIELWVNKDKAPRTVEIDPDPFKKTVVEFTPPIQLARLKLRVVAVEGGTLGQAAVGFGEIEVQGGR